MPAGVGGSKVGERLGCHRGLHAAQSSSPARTPQPRRGTLPGTSCGAKRPRAFLKRPETCHSMGKVNERLRTAMMRAGVSQMTWRCAAASTPRPPSAGSAPAASRTAGTGGRQPGASAARTTTCWPDAPGEAPARRAEASRAELVRLYPDRGSIPREMWQHLLGGRPRAHRHPGVRGAVPRRRRQRAETARGTGPRRGAGPAAARRSRQSGGGAARRGRRHRP